MPSGELSGPFNVAAVTSLERALATAERMCGLRFAIYVGELPFGRESAVALQRQLNDPATGVMIAVDPAGRQMEIVTGRLAQGRLDDAACRLACLTMASRFSIGDISAGIRDGIYLLADHARV